MQHFLIENNAKTWFAFAQEGSSTLGRDPNQANVVIEDDSISPIHARIIHRGNDWKIEDLGSLEGTYLNKKALQVGAAAVLVHGDQVSVGFRDYFFSAYPPLSRSDIALPSEEITLQEMARSERLEKGDAEHSVWLVRALERFLAIDKDRERYVRDVMDVFSHLFFPAHRVFAFEEEVWSSGLREGDAYTEMLLHEARFQTSALAFRSAVSEESGYRAMYAPLVLQDLVRGYLCLIAPTEGRLWSEQEVGFFAALVRLLGQGFSTLALLQRAQEDREVLHLNLVGIAPEMQSLKIRLLQTARQELPVLVVGEDGVGKSRIARAIHQASTRRQSPLMVLNAANFPKELFELALCGAVAEPPHQPSPRQGKVELAEGGSLLIEEIGEIPLGIQPTLLALVKSQEITPIGASEGRPCDVRLLATSSVTFNELLQQQRLIPELAEVFQKNCILVPPLRHRREDIPQLFRAFLARLGEEEGLPTAVVSDEAIALLKDHRWSMNIRELRSVVAGCFYELDPEHPIVDADLVQRVLQQKTAAANGQHSLLEKEVRALEVRLIQEAVMAANDDINEAAESLGISLVVLRRKMRKLGIG